MMTFYVTGQTLRVYTPAIAADSINYLTGEVIFADSAWDGYTKALHFTKSGTTYDITLDSNNKFGESSSLNLTTGEWEVSITGVKGSARLTANPVAITVLPSGLSDAPLHALPLSVAETLQAGVDIARATALDVKQRADAGEFNGKDGKGFTIKGYFATTASLPATGAAGDMYGIGSAAPYNIYAWDDVHDTWVNNGNIQGAKGDTGAAGKYANPTVSETGILTWAWSDGSSGGLPSAYAVKGDTGEIGPAGPTGKSAWEAACEHGYTGDENTFGEKLATFDNHHASHASGGSDALGNGSISKAMLQSGATYTALSGILNSGSGSGGWDASTKQQTISGLTGVTANNTIIVTPAPGSFIAYCEAQIRATAQGTGTVTFTCEEIPTSALTVNVLILT